MSRESRITASSVTAMREAIAKSREHGIKANLAVDLEVLEELLDARDEVMAMRTIGRAIAEQNERRAPLGDEADARVTRAAVYARALVEALEAKDVGAARVLVASVDSYLRERRGP